MADFLLDRIRFTWTAGWVSGQVYTKDDVTYYRGRVYVCITGHTAGADIRTDISKWELMFDGQEWKGDWQSGVDYGIGNIVKFKGYVYRCISNHTSVVVVNIGLPGDITNWTLIATTYDWKNTWATGVYYNLGDVVRYNGTVYICSTKHRSALDTILGLEDDQSSWTTVVASDYWTTDWASDSRYTVNDLVKYGGVVYRCIEGHTSASTTILGLENDQSRWETVLDGIEYKTAWTTSTRYKLNDIVKVDSYLYICTNDHIATLFGDDGSNWQLWIPGVGYEELWSAIRTYDRGDIVLYGGYTYVALQTNTAAAPSIDGLVQDTGNWEVITTGYNHKGEFFVETVHTTGDVVRHGGYLYVAIGDSTGSYPDTAVNSWKVVIPGLKFRAEWSDAATYYPGDIVTYLGTSYTCILRHISTSSDSRPDLDQDLDAENYWEFISKGSANNVLAAIGDMRVYDSNITRLAIGTAGQVGKVVGNLPTFQNFGAINKVYFVGLNGSDDGNFGSTENAPFRTVRFACEYILQDPSARSPATVYIKTGVFEEILPISIPADVALVGDELRSTVITPITGMEQSNMFYVRNGTGIRNMTLRGLSGTLGSQNQYLTRRPSAGAYVSLDPGTGVTDNAVQILSKSPYIQNVTTFGTGCIGLKVDGSLHDSGNKSIVANDFTQVLDDGIGVWITNGGLSELVSVFTYYNHIGYLAENGGKMRATNGNNSYGTYGSVSEGITDGITPIYASVNNQSQEAQFGVIHNNGNEIMAVSYSHAGQGYSSATINIAGSGATASLTMSDLRDGAVSNVRISPIGDSSIPGGLNYTDVAGEAQTGDTTSITLDNGDLQTDAAKYQGQFIFITGGAGIGQYGVIDTYTPATKVATIVKHTDGTAGWDRISSNYAVASELNLTTRYKIEPRLVFDAPVSGTRAWGRAIIESSRISGVNIYDPGSGYVSAPAITITDNEETIDAQFDVYINDGVLGLPTFGNRGVGYIRSTGTITGNGFAEIYQTGNLINVTNLIRPPGPGDNFYITGIDNIIYKLTKIESISGTEPNLSATIRIFPTIGIEESPAHNVGITIRQDYSQVRLTGHDFLDIGSGNVASTRYPQLYVDGIDSLNTPQQQNEAVESGGGRVFYTSTDQDGNFRVGELFEVEQSTGIVTIDASQFDLTGLTELSLGGIQVGGSAVVIKEFSKESTFVATSNNIVPTQAAIIKYLNSRISGGSSNATTSRVTAGQVTMATDDIGSNGTVINVPVQTIFTGGVGGDLLAHQLFRLRSNR